MLFALSNAGAIAADAATDRAGYTCLECGDPVSLRISGNKRSHFMHRSGAECRLRRDAGDRAHYRAMFEMLTNLVKEIHL